MLNSDFHDSFRRRWALSERATGLGQRCISVPVAGLL